MHFLILNSMQRYSSVSNLRHNLTLISKYSVDRIKIVGCKIKNVYSIQCALNETCKEFFCEMANTLTEMKGKACDAFSSGSNFSHLK